MAYMMAYMAYAQIMARRKYVLPHGEGSFYQRPDGRWIGVLEAGWTESGSRKRVTVSSADKATAWDKLAAARKRLALDGPSAVVHTPTLKAWSDQWLDHKRATSAPQGHVNLQSRVRHWIVPAIGRKRLSSLTPGDVRAVEQAVRDAGRAPATVRNVLSTLHEMLADAAREGHPIPNAVLLARRPSGGRSQRSEIPLDDMLRLVAFAREAPDGARWVAALLQGMRQGECLGLTWDRIDFERRAIDVSQQLVQVKYSDREAGTISLPADYEAIQLDGAWHLAQPKTTAGRRIVPLVPWMHEALTRWQEVAPESPHGLVWPRPDGRPRTAQGDRDEWHALTTRAGVAKPDGSRYVLHEARHSAASLLLELRVDPEVVRQIMGWSSVAMRRAYQHASPDLLAAELGRSAALLQLEGLGPDRYQTVMN